MPCSFVNTLKRCRPIAYNLYPTLRTIKKRLNKVFVTAMLQTRYLAANSEVNTYALTSRMG